MVAGIETVTDGVGSDLATARKPRGMLDGSFICSMMQQHCRVEYLTHFLAFMRKLVATHINKNLYIRGILHYSNSL